MGPISRFTTGVVGRIAPSHDSRLELLWEVVQSQDSRLEAVQSHDSRWERVQSHDSRLMHLVVCIPVSSLPPHLCASAAVRNTMALSHRPYRATTARPPRCAMAAKSRPRRSGHDCHDCHDARLPDAMKHWYATMPRYTIHDGHDTRLLHRHRHDATTTTARLPRCHDCRAHDHDCNSHPSRLLFTMALEP